MKRTKILYWIFTGLFALIMLSTALPNVMMSPDSVDLIHTQLGYPKYFILFVGVAKILGVIGILVPGYPRVKEWSYAGLFFDLSAATASAIAVEGFQLIHLSMAIFFAPGVFSYIWYHKKLKAETGIGEPRAV
jgi:DoxX-like family